MDGNPAVGVDFDGGQRTVCSGAVVLGGASDAGADESFRLLSARLLLGTLPSLSRISGVRTETL
jgi:hypothetical protein